jgi:hypothetical protein
MASVRYIVDAAVAFYSERRDLVTGVDARQILVEDPAGNPVELFERLG